MTFALTNDEQRMLITHGIINKEDIVNNTIDGDEDTIDYVVDYIYNNYKYWRKTYERSELQD